MSVDVLQEKIRKTKNPSVLDLNLSMADLPAQFEKTGEGYGAFCRELLISCSRLWSMLRSRDIMSFWMRRRSCLLLPRN